MEGVIPREKLVALCKYEPIRLWMRSCDHILYQALVEILIPDVLRPVPSQYNFHCIKTQDEFKTHNFVCVVCGPQTPESPHF